MTKEEIYQGRISVIIPAYNAEETLERCVHSVISQTYTNIEVIIVDDGSTDNTGIIAGRLAVEDCRVHLIHKKNEGVGSARNDALGRVNSKWITFVDADDYLETDFLESLITDADADLLVGGYRTVGEHEIPDVIYTTACAHNKEEIRTLAEEHLTDMTFLCPWGKLFRTSLVHSFDLRFPTDMHIGEDVVFVWDYLSHCSSIILKESKGYNYFTKPSDFKYALDEKTSLQTMERILDVLNKLKQTFGMDGEHVRRHIINYYIWLYKQYVKHRISIKDISRLKTFFYHPLVFNYYRIYKDASMDKMLVYIMLRLHAFIVLYFLIKLYY